jgi:hypothetical protein
MSNIDHPEDQLQSEIEAALANDNVPTIYFNSFINSLGTGDVLIILKRAHTPIAKLHASYTLAKTLAVKLGQMIATLEAKSGNTIMTTDDVTRIMSELGDSNEHDS